MEKENEKDSKDASIVMAFIENKASKVHDAFKEDAHFDGERMMFVDSKPYNQLEEALERYRREMAPEGLNLTLLNCSWEEVLSQLEEAKKARKGYHDGARGVLGFHKKVFRKMGHSAVVVSPGFDCIPDELGLSVLKGGLALMFNIARHRVECATKILEALEEVPDILQMAEDKRRLYPGDERLNTAIEELYGTFVTVIPQWIAYLLPKRAKDRLKAPFRQSQTDQLLFDVGHAARRVRDCAERLRDGDIADTVVLARGISEAAKATEVAVVDLGSRLAAIDDGIGRVGAGLSSEVEAAVKKVLEEERRRAHDEAVRGKNQLFQFLMEQLQDYKKQLLDMSQQQHQQQRQAQEERLLRQGQRPHSQHVSTASSQYQQQQQQEQQQPLLSPASFHTTPDSGRHGAAAGMQIPGVDPALLSGLLRALDVPAMQAAQDLQAVLRKRRAFDSAAQAQARSLWATRGFQGWLLGGGGHDPSSSYSPPPPHPHRPFGGGGGSGLLLVDANMDTMKTGKVSPMSVFCAALAVELAQTAPAPAPPPSSPSYSPGLDAGGGDTAIWLHFFCGQHTGAADPLRGPLGLARSLLAQLVRQAHDWGVLGAGFAADLAAVEEEAEEAEAGGSFGPPPRQRSFHDYLHLHHHHHHHHHRHAHRNQHEQHQQHHREGQGHGGGLSLRAVLFLLRRAVLRLAEGVRVLCVVDGVSMYEGDELRGQMLSVFRTLKEMACCPAALTADGAAGGGTAGGGAVGDERFRVMLTSAARSKVVVGEVAPSQHVLLRRGGGGGGGGGDKSFWRNARQAVSSKGAGYQYEGAWEAT